MKFNSLIRKYRLDNNLGLRNFSRLLDISPTHLSRLESNKSTPSEDLVMKLAVILRVDFDYLMISASKVPSDIQGYLLRNPSEIRRIRAKIATKE